MQSIEVIGYGNQNGKFIQNQMSKGTQSTQSLPKNKKKEQPADSNKFINTKKINIIKASKS